MKGGGGALRGSVGRIGKGGPERAGFSGMPAVGSRIGSPRTITSERGSALPRPISRLGPDVGISNINQSPRAGIIPPGPAGIRFPTTSFSRDRLSIPNFEALKPTAEHEMRHVLAGILTNSDVTKVSLKGGYDPVRNVHFLGETHILATPRAFPVIAAAGATGENARGYSDDFAQISAMDRKYGMPDSKVPAMQVSGNLIKDYVPKEVLSALTRELVRVGELEGRDTIHGLVDSVFLQVAQEQNKPELYYRFKDMVAMSLWQGKLDQERKIASQKQELITKYFKGKAEHTYGKEQIAVENQSVCPSCGAPGGRHGSECRALRERQRQFEARRLENPSIPAMMTHTLTPRTLGGRRLLTPD